jgi:hypothetical protein
MLGRTINPSMDSEDAVSTAVRIVREADLPDAAALVRRIDLPSLADRPRPELDLSRRIDLPSRIETGRAWLAGAAATLVGLLQLLPWRRQQRQRRRRSIVLGVLGVVGLALVGSWVVRRQMARRAAEAEAERLDQEAFERATGEGMAAAIGARESVPVPMEMSMPDEDVVQQADDVAHPSVADGLTERAAVDQATNGLGVAPRV